MLDSSMVVSDDNFNFRRKIRRVHEILRQAGPDGMGRAELTRKTQRILSCARDRDDVLFALEEAGLVIAQLVNDRNPQHPRLHLLALEHAPREDDGIIGVWGEDQGW